MKTEKLAFVFVGLLLFILGFDILMVVHYFKNLSGLSLIAVASILAGTFLAVMAAWFCLKPGAPTGLKIASFTAKVALILVGGLSATAVITLNFHEKREAEARKNLTVQQASQTEAEIAKIGAEKQAKIAEQEAEIKHLEALKAAVVDVRKAAGARAARDLIAKTAVTASASPSPTATPTLVASVQAGQAQIQKEAEAHTFKAWLLEYADGGIYYVPTIANLLVFIGLGAFLTFGRSISGAEKSKDEFPKEIEIEQGK